MQSGKVLRILLVEDNAEREQVLRSWLPPDVQVVVVTSAGKAIGVLRRDPGTVYAGVMLDHDLQERRVAEVDRRLSGHDVVEAMVQYLARTSPVLVHSMNEPQSKLMVARLQQAGFDVVKSPMERLTKEVLNRWLEAVRDAWEA
jgi:CheY-like chemotaxis protein